ncbi:SIS domain-containing protein [Enterococcus asini]|uniref:SIS domain-containing protein n=1 Tax=Enterococcus asini TaxID=57732 RepID=UPI002892656B|nr:SIS domain-containing protein [Enterococcus asini]MDT2756318.1 SIS domain-containing protein [Enterococcus asini]
MNSNNKMNHFIEQQFSLLPQLLEREIEIPNLEDIPNIIIFVGSGSSLNAARISEPYFRAAGNKNIFFMSPSQYLPQMDKLERHFLVAISQTGTSIATITSIERAAQAENPTILISATRNLEKREKASAFIDLYCEDEKIGPKTVGFTATLVRLIQLAEVLYQSSGRPCNFVNELRENIRLLPVVKANTEQWIETHQDWAKAPYLTITSDESFKAVIDEGALKLLETLMVPVTSYEIGEFTHGPHRLIHKGSFHIYFGLDNTEKLSKKVAEYTRKVQGKVLYLGFNHSDINLNVVQKSCGAEIVVSLVFQVLANELALLGGFNPDDKVHSNFFSYIGTKN